MIPLKTRPLAAVRRRLLAVKLPIFVVVAIIVLGGCQTPPEPVPEPEPQAPPPAPKIDPDLLADLLYRAEQALARDQVAYPLEGSALALYEEILAIEADQEDALRGLEHIVEQYIERAFKALEREQYASARSMLARARLILPDHPSIKPTEEQIRLLSEARRVTIRLQQADLERSESVAAAELKALGELPAGYDCRFTIAAKNDAQGRWIYRTLSSGSSTGRVRAQIEIRLPAGVERVCFPT